MKFKATSPTGDTVKGDVLLFVNDKEAKQFDTPADGNKFSTYVLTTPKDILSVRTAVTLEDGVEEFADCVVDGVLRSTSQIKKGKGKKTVDKAIFDKILFYRYENGKKRGLKVGQMEVASRDSTKVLSEKPSSSVGCIELQFWRKYPEEKSSANQEADDIKRAPDFEKCPLWSDLKPDEGPSEFEVGFSNEGKNTKASKDRLAEAREGFKLFASCTFHLASTETLRKLDFENVPVCPGGSATPATVTPKEDAPELPKASEKQVVAAPAEVQDTITVVVAEDELSKKELPEKSQVKPPPAPEAATTPQASPIIPDTSSKAKENAPKPKSTPVLAESIAFSFSVPDDNVEVQFDRAFDQIIKHDVEMKKKEASPISVPRKKIPKKKGTSLFGVPGGVASKLPRSLPSEEQQTPDRDVSPVATEDTSKKPSEGPDIYDDIFTFSSMEDEPSTPVLGTETPEADDNLPNSSQDSIKGQEWQPMTPPPSAKKPFLKTAYETIEGASISTTEPAEGQKPAADASGALEIDPKPQTPASVTEPVIIDSQSTRSFNDTQERVEADGLFNSEPLSSDAIQGNVATPKVPTPALVRASSFTSNTTEVAKLEDVARILSEPPRTPVIGLGISTPLMQYEVEEPDTPNTAVGHFSPPPVSPILGSSPPIRRRVSFGSATIIPSPIEKAQQERQMSAPFSRSRSSSRGPMDWEQSPSRSSSPLVPTKQHTATCTPDCCLSHVLADVLRDSVEAPAKRKADEIAEPEEFQPRKRSETPAAKFADEFQRRTVGAQARIAAAQQEMRRLEEETKEALAFEAQREAVLRLEMQAQRLERENAERKARIDAIYGK